MFGKGLIEGLGITLKHTFEKDKTIQYPEEHPYLQERFRGCLAFDFPKCIACGLCTKTCPNNVLSFETIKEEGAKKKKLQSYTIDLQYCLFCNLCVEVCPTGTLYFTHDFELSKYNRQDIKIVYHRPPELDLVPEEKEDSSPEVKTELPDTAEAEAKRLKQIGAMKTALGKNPRKSLAKILESEEEIEIITALVGADEKKLSQLAELLIDDRDKAAQLAQAWVKNQDIEQNTEKKDGLPAQPVLDDKRLKQIEAMKTALGRNPGKTLAKILESEEDIAIMTALAGADEKKLSKLAELLIDDREKAAKLAQAWVNKDKKDRSGKGGGQE